MTKFVDKMNAKYSVHLSVSQMKYAFSVIEKKGLRPPLPEHTTYADCGVYSPAQIKALKIEERFRELVSQARAAGITNIHYLDFYGVLADEFGYKRETISTYIRDARRIINADPGTRGVSTSPKKKK